MDERRIELPDADIRVFDGVFRIPEETAALLGRLLAEVAWEQDVVTVFGARRPVPRLTAWVGDPGAVYTYSGLRMEPRPWTPLLRGIADRVEPLAGVRFNSVLCNRYRDGADTVGWHRDNEPELGPEPVIASVSFGATRRFLLRHRRDKRLRAELLLEDGTVIVMRGPTQREWHHCVPRTALPVGERVNLTFRVILP